MKKLITLSAGKTSRFLSMALFLAMPVFEASAQSILVEGFESTSFPPTGWTRSTSNATYPWARAASLTGNPGPAAHGGSFMARYNSFSAPSGATAELVTPSMNFTLTNQVAVSFWLYRDPNYVNYLNEKVDVFVNTSNSSTGGAQIGSLIRWTGANPVVSSAGWYQATFLVPPSYNSATNYIIFKATSQFGNDMYIDDVSIYNIPPCTGPTAAGTVSPSGTQTVCPGTSANLQVTGVGIAGNTTQQWQYSTNGGTNWNSTGTSAPNYTTFAIVAPVRFRFFNVCNNTGDTTFSNTVIFNLSSSAFPQYASLPFFESFESWSNGCSTTDIPSSNWTNSPTTGISSFRRDDQGASAAWTSPPTGAYTPVAALGAHSARFHSYYAYGPTAAKGVLSAYVDCSTPGNKEIQFYLLTAPTSTYQDSCYLDYSQNGGISWTNLATYGAGSGLWDFKSQILPSNSATTVVRWTIWRNANSCCQNDIGLDGVRILPPCAAKPFAGIIDSVSVCPNKNFTLSASGTSAAAGLSYQWQSKATGSVVGWSSLPGGTIARPSANISVPTSFRVVVTCTNTTPNVSDTSAVFDVPLSPFYYCYCDMPSSITFPTTRLNGISNVSVATQPGNVVLMSNSSGLNYPYISYARTVSPPILIRDSTYRFSMTDVGGTNGSVTPCYASFFLDWNRNGIWDLPQERIMTKTTNMVGQIVTQDYQIPPNASTGLTGLRAIHAYVLTPPLDPCGNFYYNGECEDYLVYLQYQPCNGPVNAGTAYASDTVVCPGYSIDIWDTSYERQRTGIMRSWEVSNNLGASYTTIAGSADVDTMFNVTVTASVYGLRYRLRAICGNTGDTSYSSYVSVSNPNPISCYPFASAIPPGSNDSSDIGSFVIGPYVNPQPMVVSGPHLMNPLANRRRTDYTHISPAMTLAADSTYRIAVYHTMRGANHADALVSVFIDFNNDGQYTAGSPGYPYPPELVFRGVTHKDSFYLDSRFTMPSNLIGGVPTGLRVVLNNDLNPTGPGNTGAGGFVSGEVEDYVVTLTGSALGIDSRPAIQNLSLFPNPTGSKATLIFDASRSTGFLELTVSTITGQQVMIKRFENVTAHLETEIDLSKRAKGIYFVELKTDEGQKIVRKLILE